MDGPQLLLLYNTMVLPHLQYCLVNWGNFKGDRNLGLRDRLVALQKCLVRIISGAHRSAHADPLFYNLGTLKVDDLFTQSIRVFCYQLSRGQLPVGMATFITKNDHGHMTRGARSNFFVGRSDSRSIRGIAPKVWNSAPVELKGAPSVAAFKERSKADLLASYGSFVCSVRGCWSCASGH